MRKCAYFMILLSVVSLFFSIGCTDKKVAATDTVASDTLPADTAETDTLENLIADTPMPKAADELFDDFIFNFAANRKLQINRITFPLPVERDGTVSHLKKSQWKMEHFFMRQGYYTLIFDNQRQMSLVKDTTIGKVIVEKVYFKTKTVKQYEFNRVNGLWMLQAIRYKGIDVNKNASFLKFYQQFATDTAFQHRSLNDYVTFTGPDPDDDFSRMTGSIAPEQWSSFAPELPHSFIYNILYGQTYSKSNQKIFVLRGIANGLETELTFKKIKGRWKLVKLST
ncbi:MAG: DUF4348 domain-containing protein [Hoylesella marshii]|uniref:DUF4348 domain-containing protein n=2 Tax=Hoylesella marshii TaxID=189722 RepID=E0NRM7_9BACT|nr:DUF4348 domain-containing protein [Hoylesella marshii]EFM02165.1 hypothetical protein HMPREF0658_0828 [Hoylesella marshii DSM 16973 = JCM 13450]